MAAEAEGAPTTGGAGHSFSIDGPESLSPEEVSAPHEKVRPSSGPTRMPQSRITWVDNAKALGIVAIVAGHDPAISEAPEAFLYAFHVPLFFFLSGYLTKRQLTEEPLGEYLRRNARRLLVPYVCFWGMSFSLWVGFRVAAGKPEWHEAHALAAQLRGLVVAQPDALEAVNGPLWFYTALFLTTLLFYGLAQARARWVMPASLLPLAALGLLIATLFPSGLVWNLHVVCVAATFFVAGHLVKREGWFAALPATWLLALASVACAVVTYTVAQYNGRADTAWAFFGASYPLFWLGAFAGIGMVMAGAALLPGSRAARFLSDHTLTIFSIHVPMFYAFSGVGEHVFGQPNGFDRDGSLPPLVYPALALVLCVPLSLFLRRYAPWSVGQGSARKRADREPKQAS